MNRKLSFVVVTMLVALFAAGTVNAQTYSTTCHRTNNIANSGGIVSGGSTTISVNFLNIKAEVRGVPQFDYTTTYGVGLTSTNDFRLETTNTAWADVGYLCLDYADLTKNVINVMAGQEFTITTKCQGQDGWANAVMFVDWDGNGSFDDHDPELYNLYGISNVSIMEWNGKGSGDDDKDLKASWTVKVPKTYSKEFTTRIRLKVDEGIAEEWEVFRLAMNNKDLPIWLSSYSDGNYTSSGYHGNSGRYQKFYSAYPWRFMPTAQMYKGCTVDLTLHITPDELQLADDHKTVQDDVVVVGTGNVADCVAAPTGTAISNEAGFEAFLAATSGDYYLANDITISSTLDVSQSVFTGTFDGNGHTITINPTKKVVSATALSKDECFYPYPLIDDSTFTIADVTDRLQANFLPKAATKDAQPDMTNYPQKVIAGGFCGVLAKGGVIKNVKVVYEGSELTYSCYGADGTNGALFGLVAGINKGTIENVALTINESKVVRVGVGSDATRKDPSALGGIAGILYRGIVKNCTVDINGTFDMGKAYSASANSNYVGINSCMGGLIGRLQSGVVSNVKFGGASTGVMSMGVYTGGATRYCMGGIAGMLYTPQGTYGGSANLQDYTWGYDNGTVGPDVNNVIISYAGSMNDSQSSTYTAYTKVLMRGLLFAEATDTVLVPNLITQYATAPTAQENVNTTSSTLSGTNIPLVSRTYGHHAKETSINTFTDFVGQLYLGQDARVANKSTSTVGSWLNVSTVTDTKLDFAQVVDPTYCTTASTSYVVATYTGADTNIQGIEGESSNVTWQEDKDGNPYVQIDTDPSKYTTSSWTWSHNPSTPGGSGSGAGDFSCSTKTEEHGYCATPIVSGGTAINDANDWNNNVTGTGTFYLMNDITITGFNKGTFGGTIYGNGHTITINGGNGDNRKTYNGVDYAGGLFSYITGTGKIQDLTVVYSGAVTTNNINATTGNDIAIGLIAGGSEATINNVRVVINAGVTVNAKFNGTPTSSAVGGILGTTALGGRVTNATLENNGTFTTNASNIGGIVGISSGNALDGANLILRGTGSLAATGTDSQAAGICNLKNTANVDGFVYALTGGLNANTTATTFAGTVTAGGAPSATLLSNSDIAAMAVGDSKVVLIANPHKGNGYFLGHTGGTVTSLGTSGTGTTAATTADAITAAAQTLINNTTYQFTITKTASGFSIVSVSDGYYMRSNDNPITWKASAPTNYLFNIGDAASNGGVNLSASDWASGLVSENLLRIISTYTSSYVNAGGAVSKLKLATGTGEWSAWYLYEVSASVTPAALTRYYMMDNAGTDANAIPIYNKVVRNEVCTGVFSKTDITSTVTAYLKNGNLTLAACDIDALTTEEVNAYVNDECTMLGSGKATPTAEAHASTTAPTTATHLYLVTSTEALGIKVTARCGEDGGGWVSDDMGRSDTTQLVKNPYNGEMFTAIPDGPFLLEGWYLSTDDGATFTKVSSYIDYTYTGTVDAILEARFTFTDYAGDFGKYKFTDATVVPYYINEVTTADAEINIVNPEGVSGFGGYAWTGGEKRMIYLSDAYVGMLPTSILASQTVTVTVTMKNMGTFPLDARLLAFLDYNNNRYFDFASNSDGTTAGLTANNELVFVANGDGTDMTAKLGTPICTVNGTNVTYTFQISNTMFPDGEMGTTRLRFYAGRYVDKYGLGPVNDYNNLSYRYDGAETSNDRITLNDNNGSTYSPNDQVNLDDYVNVLDVNAEIMAYIPYNKTWTIQNGKNYEVRDLYIESKDTDAGPESGRVTFDAGSPYGRLHVTGNIIVRKQLYKDRWHHVAFPVEMDGTAGTHGICELNDVTGKDYKIADSQWLMMTFDPAGRNVAGGYNSGRSTPATTTSFKANTFYWVAADPSANGTVLTEDGANYTWFDFYTKEQGYLFTPKRSGVITFSDQYRVQDAANFTDRNVYAIYNPFFSAIDTRELKDQGAVGGWEEIRIWNSKLEHWIGVDPTTNRAIYPFTGWWIHLTEKAEAAYNGTAYTIDLGALNGSFTAADPHPTQGPDNVAARRSAENTATVDLPVVEIPDAYFVGLDYVANKENINYISGTQVLLTTDGTATSTADRHDCPVSLANGQATIPEIWSIAGTSTKMMATDVQRAERVEVPMGIRIRKAGEYILKLKSSNVNASLVSVYDKETGATIELKNGEQMLDGYEFLSEAGDFDRFTLIIVNPKSSTGLERVESDGTTTIYATDNAVHFSNIPEGYSVDICDVVGRTLSNRLVDATEMDMTLPVNRGVYLISVRDEKGNVVETVKVVK